MARTRGSYPHPVLDSTDDVASTFEVFNFTFSPNIDDVEIQFQIRMDDPELLELLRIGDAKYSFHWTCSSTINSGRLTTVPSRNIGDSTVYIGGIDQQEVRGIVRLEFKIIATKVIPNYSLRKQHSDYGDAQFALRPGDVIADGGYVDFEPAKLYDPLNPPVGSCFKFVSDSTRTKGISVRFDDNEHVNVLFPERLLQGFGMLKNDPDLQISLVVLPALMETISFIKESLREDSNDEDLSEKQWYSAVKSLVESVGNFEDSAFDTAQKILGHRIDAYLLNQLNAHEDED